MPHDVFNRPPLTPTCFTPPQLNFPYAIHLGPFVYRETVSSFLTSQLLNIVKELLCSFGCALQNTNAKQEASERALRWHAGPRTLGLDALDCNSAAVIIAGRDELLSVHWLPV